MSFLRLRLPPVLLLLLLLSFLLLFSPSTSTELDQLLNLKASLETSNPALFTSWNQQTPTCNFTGVVCNSNGLVSEINLSQNNLSGSLPFNSICSLPQLEKLSFGSNFLHGSLTEDLKNCTSLHELDLGSNSFTGEVPDLSSLSQLRLLSLNASGFSGIFPWKSIENLTELRFLSIGYNRFEKSPIAMELAKLDKLYWLYLSNCSITGEIPTSIGNLTLLENLELADNLLVGEIPPSISNLNKLWQLELYGNFLTGKIPVGFGNLTSLRNFDASANQLEGDLSELKSLTGLASLQLYYNQIVGSVPEEFGEFKNLADLVLYGNKLTGSLPQKLGSWSGLDYIDVSENYLTGPIPPGMCKNERMVGILLLQNNFTGGIPESYVNCKSLVRLRVNNNSFSGTVPAGIWSLPNVTIIDLSMNQFEGPLPSDVGKANFLSFLLLSNNQFSGQLPAALFQATSEFSSFNLTNLRYLDLHSNQFHGQIPNFPFSNNASSLVFMSLSSNNLSGTIPESLCNSPILQILDLSGNFLSGTVPRCLTTIRELEVLNLRRNNLTNVDEFSSDCSLKTLDISGNQIQGHFLKSLINCTRLEVLNLGNNVITEPFPCSLRNTSTLRVLVLRSNKFYGGIGCQMTNGTWPLLQIIDLAHNNFSGEVAGTTLTTWQAMKSNKGNTTWEIDRPQSSWGGYYSLLVTTKGRELELVKVLTIFISIDFSSNKFNGSIPEEIGNLRSLYALNLSHNAFTGAIPSSLSKLRQLESLDLSKNTLSGQIPPELIQLTFLAFLNLSYNQLVGRIPAGAQFSTFDEASFQGNKGLWGFTLRADNRTRFSSPELEESNLNPGNEIDWDIISPEIGFTCGFGVAIGSLLFCKRWRKFFYRAMFHILLKLIPQLEQRIGHHKRHIHIHQRFSRR